MKKQLLALALTFVAQVSFARQWFEQSKGAVGTWSKPKKEDKAHESKETGKSVAAQPESAGSQWFEQGKVKTSPESMKRWIEKNKKECQENIAAYKAGWRWIDGYNRTYIDIGRCDRVGDKIDRLKDGDRVQWRVVPGTHNLEIIDFNSKTGKITSTVRQMSILEMIKAGYFVPGVAPLYCAFA